MNVDELWRELGKTDALPKAAIEASLENWDGVSARYVSKLRAFANGAKTAQSDRDALFCVIHMCAQMKDTRAYSPLSEILARDADVEMWLGDALTETLPKILISLCDGDVEPLKQVVAAKNADEWAHSAALSALAYVVRTQSVMTDDETCAYLKSLAGGLRAETPITAAGWAAMIAALGYERLKADVARVMSKGYIDPEFYDIKAFHADLQLARSTPEGLAVFELEHIGPFGSTIEALANWQWGAEPENGPDGFGQQATSDDAPDFAVPLVNPYRDVGRNDPCPCGSGKKFKKCCLAA